MVNVNEMSLDQLANNGDEGFEVTTPFAKKLKMEVAYPVKIVAETFSVSEAAGYNVMKMELGVIQPDGSTTKGDTLFNCLPVFSDEVQASSDPEKLKALKSNWGKQLLGILRAIDPQTWSVYYTSTKVNGKFRMFDYEGNEMNNADRKAREDYLSKAAIGVAKAMVAGKYSLLNKTCYFVWAPNKNPAKDPYANFWSVAPDKYPLAQ